MKDIFTLGLMGGWGCGWRAQGAFKILYRLLISALGEG